MTVRTLPHHELEQILPLLRQVHDLHVVQRPDHYHPITDAEAAIAWLKDWTAKDNLVILVCGPPTALTGYLIYKEEHREASLLKPAVSQVVLDHICVDECHRRKGLGGALIAAMRDRVRGEKVDRITVTYAAFNKASAALMAREGFVPTYVRSEMSL